MEDEWLTTVALSPVDGSWLGCPRLYCVQAVEENQPLLWIECDYITVSRSYRLTAVYQLEPSFPPVHGN